MLKKKRIKESLLLFWESGLVVRLRDSFVVKESFATDPSLACAHMYRHVTSLDCDQCLDLESGTILMVGMSLFVQKTLVE